MKVQNENPSNNNARHVPAFFFDGGELDMKQSIILHDRFMIARAVMAIQGVEFDPLHEVVIRPHKEQRSIQQNSLYWQWMTELGNEVGWEKEESSRHYKEMFLVQIFRRDDEEYAEMLEAVNRVHSQGLKSDAMMLKKQIVKLTSTTKASVKQFTEYLTSIQREAACIGCVLTIPDDMGWMNV